MRTSAAWQALDVVEPTSTAAGAVAVKVDIENEESVSGVSGQVSSLLSRLAPSSSVPSALEDPTPQVGQHNNHLKQPASVKTLTYSQSLPIIGQLASEEQFLRKVKKVAVFLFICLVFLFI